MGIHRFSVSGMAPEIVRIAKRQDTPYIPVRSFIVIANVLTRTCCIVYLVTSRAILPLPVAPFYCVTE